MTPHDFAKVRPQFEAAAHALGWQRRFRAVEYPYGTVKSWYWIDRHANYLFDEADLSAGLAAEAVRLAAQFLPAEETS